MRPTCFGELPSHPSGFRVLHADPIGLFLVVLDTAKVRRLFHLSGCGRVSSLTETRFFLPFFLYLPCRIQARVYRE